MSCCFNDNCSGCYKFKTHEENQRDKALVSVLQKLETYLEWKSAKRLVELTEAYEAYKKING